MGAISEKASRVRLEVIVVLRSIALALVLMVAASSYAQPDATHEMVLVPFDTLVVNGSGGEVWKAELRVRNSADVAVNLFPETCFTFGRPIPCDLRIDVAAGVTQPLDVRTYDSLRNPGLLLYVPNSHRQELSFSLTVRNVAADDTVGTSVPVVRASQLQPVARIVGVPIVSGHRVTLRVYDPFLFANPVFRVRVIDEATNALLADRKYSQLLPTDPPTPALVPETFDFSDALAVADQWGAERVTVIVDRVWPPNLGYWPMISVTSNADGRIAIFTPQ